jgi:hypothetical protein
MFNPLSDLNLIVAVGSVDGMAAAAACMRYTNNPDIQLFFTQAFQVNMINPSEWPPESKVGFIDLAVNNEGTRPNEQLTIDFVEKIYNQGHKILFIADEHGKAAWQRVLEKCGHDRKELTIRPKNRTDYKSSCAILLKRLGDQIDKHTIALLHAGDQADQMNFDTPFGQIFNRGIKSNMMDPKRRPYLVKHLAFNELPDELIQGWMDEYSEMEQNLPKILEEKRDLGNGIIYLDGSIGRHDATTLFKEAYSFGPIVVLSGTTIFSQGRMQQGSSIATNQSIDLLKIIQEAGISAGGMPAKANLATEDIEKAILAIRHAIEQ